MGTPLNSARLPLAVGGIAVAEPTVLGCELQLSRLPKKQHKGSTRRYESQASASPPAERVITVGRAPCAREPQNRGHGASCKRECPCCPDDGPSIEVHKRSLILSYVCACLATFSSSTQSLLQTYWNLWCTSNPTSTFQSPPNMGGQPYIYDPPVRYSTLYPQNAFDPKAVSRASLAPPPPPKPRQEGPLLSFNRHPDSYLVLPHGNTSAVPMSPNTKVKIKWARHVQLAFRATQLIGAVGMLICVICLKGMSDNEGWVLRLPVL
jgi:hypothetical protein